VLAGLACGPAGLSQRLSAIARGAMRVREDDDRDGFRTCVGDAFYESERRGAVVNSRGGGVGGRLQLIESCCGYGFAEPVAEAAVPAEADRCRLARIRLASRKPTATNLDRLRPATCPPARPRGVVRRRGSKETAVPTSEASQLPVNCRSTSWPLIGGRESVPPRHVARQSHGQWRHLTQKGVEPCLQDLLPSVQSLRRSPRP
jgi:hypothetical protein